MFTGYFYNAKFLEKNNTINILSFNTLMAFPDKALSEGNKLNTTFDNEKITTIEFKKILDFLYKNNYILVDILELVNHYQTTSNFYIKSLPQNKKPIVLSFENVTYKSNYQNHGEVDKIIIDRNNKLATYTTKKSIQDRIQYDNEFLVILENFIETHPDFSYNNARGILFFSGENGVLGYNTNHKNASSKYEIERASTVISHLRKLGWTFGCNSYTYNSDRTKSQLEFKKELQLWKKEISPLISSTPIYSFPKGELDEDKLTELADNGFNILLHNDVNSSIETIGNQILISKKPVNGQTLRNNKKELLQFFDCESVYDKVNRTVPYN